ncbi:hypothetical protein Ahy_A05g023546 [Arachis hypogaea]|uniref:S-protein homolog n=1 Tax=Arachis hypogaea TaxID=3818 RepID=A0A445D3Q9_ARAHY|nr:hypothetical protein Ahy_A05g023546 [Arachis hypogaea]
MTIASSSLSKVVITVSMIMLILVSSFNLNVGMSVDRTITLPWTVHVTMNNKLNGLRLGLHCKDKNHDLGVQIVPVGQSWTFLFHTTDFSNSLFGWLNGGIHAFDIYVDKRDAHLCQQCTWDISEKGPCRVSGKGAPVCYPWNN